MDIDTLRSIMTVVVFLAFLGIVIWVYGAAQKPRFERAAMLPFEEDGPSDGVSGARQ